MFIFNLLFKKRKSFGEIFGKDFEDSCPEFFAKILKPILWWIIIGLITHSVNQPIGSHTPGFRAKWPLDLMWFCIHNSTDAARKLTQYRISVDW